ncbi:MAG: hypothetical protein NBKEAIPA_01453 [Nitrospirae bacterium]|nr:MAG: Endonuclease/Exonuclease/phosphatase family protein [Nitrospira sp. OLB3]MBV6469555.1 hypothetical protein [Nitrospirota bacterium]MCK6493431.1 endonuclease/exonuclease/phosphatase family protein [Nitrospira sp.]MEB2338923.1 endonuclease/exonuclease/phosphatase family protein [Nitrospirales bacterium]
MRPTDKKDLCLRVASYNIHRGIGRDGRYEPERILRVLEEMAADIVALQEVDLPGTETATILPWLAGKLNMAGVEGPVWLRDGREYGNALLSRFPVEQVRHWDLSVGWHEPRGALDVDVRYRGRSIHVVSTHLGLWPHERPLQAKRLLELLAVDRRELTVLMGDLNEWHMWGRVLRALYAVFGVPPAPPTFPARWPLLALDRIWVAPPTALLGVEAHRSEASRVASDHLPVKAELRLRADRWTGASQEARRSPVTATS